MEESEGHQAMRGSPFIQRLEGRGRGHAIQKRMGTWEERDFKLAEKRQRIESAEETCFANLVE